jgi:hypothetical protein
MQRNFEPMRKQVEAWQKYELTDVTAKVIIYDAFLEGKLEAPKHLARSVHDLSRTEVRGTSAANDLESIECVHLGLQGTGPHPTVQIDSQPRRIPGIAVLAIVLGFVAVPAGPPPCCTLFAGTLGTGT